MQVTTAPLSTAYCCCWSCPEMTIISVPLAPKNPLPRDMARMTSRLPKFTFTSLPHLPIYRKTRKGWKKSWVGCELTAQARIQTQACRFIARYTKCFTIWDTLCAYIFHICSRSQIKRTNLAKVEFLKSEVCYWLPIWRTFLLYWKFLW